MRSGQTLERLLQRQRSTAAASLLRYVDPVLFFAALYDLPLPYRGSGKTATQAAIFEASLRRFLHDFNAYGNAFARVPL